MTSGAPHERIVTTLRPADQRTSDPRAAPYPARHALTAVLAVVAVVLLTLILLFVSAWLARPRLDAYIQLSAIDARAFADRQSSWFSEVRDAAAWILAPLFTVLTLLLGMLISRAQRERD